jgi:hypothetical protein
MQHRNSECRKRHGAVVMDLRWFKRWNNRKLFG